MDATFEDAGPRRISFVLACILVLALLGGALHQLRGAGMTVGTPPTGCGSVGAGGVIPLSFPDPVGATVETATSVVGSSVTYSAVGSYDGQTIDARATLDSIAGGTIEFENSTGNDANLRLERSGIFAMSAEVTWDFHVSGDPTSPVPPITSWIIPDIDGGGRDSLSIEPGGLTSMQALTLLGVSLDGSGDPATATGNLIYDLPGPPPPSEWVQLDFAGVSSVTITYGLGTADTSERFSHVADGELFFLPAVTTCVGVSDHDADGTVDLADLDDDNDGIPDLVEGDLDADGDGIPNHKDLDADNDGVSDLTEDGGSSGAADFDEDTTPNFLDPDSDGDGIDDATESGHGLVAVDGRVSGSVGDNGMVDAAETTDLTDATASSEAYSVADLDGGTVDYLEAADIAVVSISSPTAVPGTQATITVELANNGNGAAGPVSVSYPLPTDITLDPVASPGCTTDSGNVVCVAAGTIADGATPSVAFVVDIAPSATTATLATSATISQTATPDENDSNDTAIGTLEVLAPIADVELTSVAGPSVVPGNATTVAIGYLNNGPSASSFEIAYPLPSTSTFNTVGSSAGCVLNGGGDTVVCSVLGPVAPSSSGTVTVAVTTLGTAPPGVENLAVAVQNPTATDPDDSNDSTSATFTVSDAVADIGVSATTPTIVPGETGTTTLAASYLAGPSTATDTEIIYVLPVGAVVDTLPGACGEAPTGTVTCAAGDLAAGSASFDITVALDSAAVPAATLAGTVTATTTAIDADGAAVGADITVGAAAADLVVTVTDPAPITLGDVGNVTVEVANDGPSDAPGTTLVYVLPIGLFLDPGFSPPSGCAESPIATVTCTIGTVAAGASASYEFEVLMPTSALPLASFVGGRATAATTVIDTSPLNNLNIGSTITSGTGQADLEVTVDAAPTLAPGATGQLELTVSNDGPSPSGEVDVTWVLPPGVAFDPTDANPDGCSETAGVVTCRLTSSIAVGNSVGVVLPVLMLEVQPTAGPIATVPVVLLNPTIADLGLVDNSADVTVALDLSGDSDGDGIADSVEIDPASLGIPQDVDGDARPDYLDVDADNDGIPDAVESDGGGSTVDTDGDSRADHVDRDSDNDGILDVVEGGNGVLDSDGDGAVDAMDLPATGDLDGDGLADAADTSAVDTDGTGQDDYRDLDADGDGLFDVVEGGNGSLDGDGDGRLDDVAANDADGDGVHDGADASVPDFDSDGRPDAHDVDSDNDGILDAVETDSGDATVDTDGDTRPDHLDLDADNDGIPDVDEGGNGALDADGDGRLDAMDIPATGDVDRDGLADGAATAAVNSDNTAGPDDFRDLDADDDGVFDVVEGGNGLLDLDGDGRLDAMLVPALGDVNADGLADVADTDPPDADSVDGPDYQDLDADGDGVFDVVESGNGALDTDDDGRVDNVAANDADGDGVHDGVRAAIDTDGDGVPDLADADTDGDGLADSTEGAGDSDGDGIADNRDLDSDNDGVPDVSEALDSVVDLDGDGVVDGQAALDGDGDGQADPARDAVPNDTDDDGQADHLDLDADGDGVPDVAEAGNRSLDGDGDGVIDAMSDPVTADLNGDGLADTADTTIVDFDGDGRPDGRDIDSDNDGLSDGVESDGGATVDTDGDGSLDRNDLDSDNDGIPDTEEGGNGGLDADDDGTLDAMNVPDTGDADRDGMADAAVSAPPNTDGSTGPDDYRDLDADDDGVLDVLEGGNGTLDVDGDGMIDAMLVPADGDADGNGLADLAATTPRNSDGLAAPDYRDLDADDDGVLDVLEGGNGALDVDGDGVIDDVEGNDVDGNGVHDGVVPPVDTDGDGLPNGFDLDADGDGIADADEGVVDTDRDGLADRLDLDSDNDGVADIVESGNGSLDGDGDGVIDDQTGPIGVLVAPGFSPTGLLRAGGVAGAAGDTPPDADGDGLANHRDLDSDGDGLFDIVESGNGSLDGDGDGVVDAMSDPAVGDADGDGIADLADNRLVESDGDGVPDFLDTDSDGDGFPDSEEFDPAAPDRDTDGDGIPDRLDADVAALAGLITGPDGKPASGLTVTIVTADGVTRTVTTGPDGRYELTSAPGSVLAPGAATISVRFADGRTVTQSVVVVAGVSVVHDLAAGSSILAFTGASTWRLTWLAAVLIVWGRILITVSDRRRRSFATPG